MACILRENWTSWTHEDFSFFIFREILLKIVAVVDVKGGLGWRGSEQATS
jgi:hypothetical protein